MLTTDSAIEQITKDFEDVALGQRNEGLGLYTTVTQTFGTLAGLYDALRQTGLPAAVTDSFSIETISAISTAGTALQRLFFEDGQRVVLTIDGQSSPLRPLVEFVREDLLHELTKYVRGCLETVTNFGREPATPISPGWDAEIGDFIVRWLAEVCSRNAYRNPESLEGLLPRADPKPMSASMIAAVDHWIAETEELRGLLRSQLAVAATEEAAEQAQTKIRESTQRVQQATGDAGANALGLHYNRLGDTERRSAQLWSVTAVVAIVVAVVLAVTTLGRWVSEAGWATQLVHLAITLPVIAGGVYASRVGSRHRAQAWKANELAAQLKTLAAFADALDDGAQLRLREQFGAKVFVGVFDSPHDASDAGVNGDRRAGRRWARQLAELETVTGDSTAAATRRRIPQSSLRFPGLSLSSLKEVLIPIRQIVGVFEGVAPADLVQIEQIIADPHVRQGTPKLVDSALTLVRLQVDMLTGKSCLRMIRRLGTKALHRLPRIPSLRGIDTEQPDLSAMAGVVNPNRVAIDDSSNTKRPGHTLG